MILRKFHTINFYFARNRVRREVKVEPQLKDFSRGYRIQKQMDQMREEYEMGEIEKPFSEGLHEEHPKLGRRFHVNKKQLNKKIKLEFNKGIRFQDLEPAGPNQDDLKFLHQGKSHLFDQNLEFQFQQKFQKQLFKKKQTNRLIKAQETKLSNYLPHSENSDYHQYLQNKKVFKNKRIQNMMSFQKNNEELKLLIQSGFIEENQNLKLIMKKMQETVNVEQLTDGSSGSNYSTEIQKINEEPKQISQKGHRFEEQLMKNIEGPEQLKNQAKLAQFLGEFQKKDRKEKEKALENINLLQKIKEYEQKLFLQRYKQINFRFKGQVKFDFMLEHELLSYVKHTDILPIDLLLIYRQNKNLLSRHHIPIITHPVMVRMYTKSSFYKFPENMENNRINMLNDPLFVDLEKAVFTQLHQANDSNFSEATWAFAKNHAEEQGVLKPMMFGAIQQIIMKEFAERSSGMKTEDLGLVCRAAISLGLTVERFQSQWKTICFHLRDKIDIATSELELQSMVSMLAMLPATKGNIQTLGISLKYFKKFEWKYHDTLRCFLNLASLVIKVKDRSLNPFRNKSMILIKEMFYLKKDEMKILIPQLSINNIPHLLIVFEQLSQFSIGHSISHVLINVSKKHIVDTLNTQKQLLANSTVPKLCMSLALLDFQTSCAKLLSYEEKLKESMLNLIPREIMDILTFRSLLPKRIFPYNSINYFIYQQLSKLIAAESTNLTIDAVVNSLVALSIVNFKNEGFFDAMITKVYERMEQTNMKLNDSFFRRQDTNSLVKLIGIFAFQKRSNALMDEIFENILNLAQKDLIQIEPSLLIRFFNSYISVHSLQTTKINQTSINSFQKNTWNQNQYFILTFRFCYQYLITPYLPSISKNDQIVTAFLLAILHNNLYRSLKENQLQTAQIKQLINLRSTFIDNFIEIINSLKGKKQDSFSEEERFLISLCCTLFNQRHYLESFDITKDLSSQKTTFFNFEISEQLFYNSNIQRIQEDEQFIGTKKSYRKVYSEIFEKIQKQSKNTKDIIKKPWRIENLEKKKVYFLASYEHLMSKQANEETVFSMFGLWKIYFEWYKIKGWQFELICTTREG